MDASIIIPIYRRTEWIKRSLFSLQEQDFNGSFEVILIDDGSPNETEIKASIDPYLKSERFQIRYVRKRHAGPAAARNYGVRNSSGNILCFIDDDSIPASSWLREIINSFSASDQTAIVSGCTLSYDRENVFPLLLEKAVYSGKTWATCNIAYRRDVFEKLGGFDEIFADASWEDNDLGIRARWAGYKHIVNEDAIVYHRYEHSLEEYIEKCLLNGRGAFIFSRKCLFERPLWGVGTPIIMSRHLFYGIFPSAWGRTATKARIKFLWSFYSLRGFIEALIGQGRATKHKKIF